MNEQEVPAVGQTAPDFSVSDSAGAMRTLSELVSGGPFVLVFYRGHW
jgi:peroxiredoxin Q/BCP